MHLAGLRTYFGEWLRWLMQSHLSPYALSPCCPFFAVCLYIPWGCVSPSPPDPMSAANGNQGEVYSRPPKPSKRLKEEVGEGVATFYVLMPREETPTVLLTSACINAKSCRVVVHPQEALPARLLVFFTQNGREHLLPAHGILLLTCPQKPCWTLSWDDPWSPLLPRRTWHRAIELTPRLKCERDAMFFSKKDVTSLPSR